MSEARPAARLAWAPPFQFILPLEAPARRDRRGALDRPGSAPRVVFGVHGAGTPGAARTDPDAALEAVAVLDPSALGAPGAELRLDLYVRRSLGLCRP